MRDEILGQLKAALPVDGVILGLHGAMVAYGYDDCEGDLLERVRAMVGPKVPIGVEYDPHSHLTKKRVANADVSICFKEFPHTDFVDRAEELVDIVIRAVKGEVKPVMSVYDCRMIGSFPTTIQPMRGFVDKIKAMEGKDGILSISVVHCFPYADVPELGAKIIVVTDDRKEDGDRLAAELGREFVGMRGKTLPHLPHDRRRHRQGARGEPGHRDHRRPVRQCRRRRAVGFDADPALPAGATVEDAAIGPIWDPMAVRFCFDAGEGAQVQAALRRQDRRHVRPAGRCRGRGAEARARQFPDLRQGARTARRLRRRSAPAASTWC